MSTHFRHHLIVLILCSVLTFGVFSCAKSEDSDSKKQNTSTDNSTTSTDNSTAFEIFCHAVGYNGTLLKTLDGDSWTRLSTGTSSNLYGIRLLNGTNFVFGDDATILRTNNFLDWLDEKQSIGGNDSIRDIAYAPSGSFVGKYAIAFIGSVEENFNLAHSDDMILWIGQGSDSGLGWRSKKRIYSVAHGNETFIQVGDNGSISKYTLGINSGTTNNLNKVRYLNNNFIVVGDNGTIVKSVSGDSWSLATSGTLKNLKAVTYGNNLFVVVGDEGEILTSNNGNQWSSKSSGTTNNLNGIIYSKGLFLIVGDSGEIITSSNGSSWTKKVSGVSYNLQDIECE